MKPTPQIDDEDIDKFVAKWFTQLNPALSAEKRADLVHDFVVGVLELSEPEKSPAWIKEFARRVRQRVLWLKASTEPSA